MSAISTATADAPRPRLAWMRRLVQRRPFVGLVALAILSNVAGSLFSFFYNDFLIVRRYLDAEQTRVFWNVASPLYNIVAYPTLLTVTYIWLRPLIRCRTMLQRGEAVDPTFLLFCRQRLLNLPVFQLVVNFGGWIPGAIVFPALITGLGGMHEAASIWTQFAVSFAVSACFTTVQTFFPIEQYLIAVFYPDFFKDTRPAAIPNVIRVPFHWRLRLLWSAVGFMPLVAMFAVVLNAIVSRQDQADETIVASVVCLASIASGAVIFRTVGDDLLTWMRKHGQATEAIAGGNLDVRIADQRPDEWGRLTDRFNDMADSLGAAEKVRDTFGQFVSPEVRDDILARFQGLEVGVQNITVLFADIRGFTRRCAHETPERVRDLLNRFLTLSVVAIEGHGGWVNKFLGDGVMALFGATRPLPDQADIAVASALELLARLGELNAELSRLAMTPLEIGIGIHSGPALVGCFGSSVTTRDGTVRLRREFTAIGETVNLCQRLEQLTKHFGGPILVSDATAQALRQRDLMTSLGEQALPGSDSRFGIWRVQ